MFKFLHNLSFKSKLMLLVIFPMAGFLIFGVTNSYRNYKEHIVMQKLSDLVKVAQKISVLVHEIQKERGMSAGYIGSGGKKFASNLPNQRTMVDKRLNELNSFLSLLDLDIYPEEFKHDIKDAINDLKEINTIREEISSLKIPLKKSCELLYKN